LPLSERPTVAVLPFINMSGDREQEYFSDGISEDIITALSKLRWFFVIALNSSLTYKGNAVHLKQVAEELGVRYVVEGSVRKVGDLVRITAQLNDTTTGSHIWAEHYDRDLTDGFAVQDEITDAIVATIEPKIYLAENFRARRKPPNSLDAWGPVMRDWYGGTNRGRRGRSGGAAPRATEYLACLDRQSIASGSWTRTASITWRLSAGPAWTNCRSARLRAAARRANAIIDRCAAAALVFSQPPRDRSRSHRGRYRCPSAPGH
jgi:TolB-like protein